jgi:phenylalanyl-tRNA synthetase beta chain
LFELSFTYHPPGIGRKTGLEAIPEADLDAVLPTQETVLTLGAYGDRNDFYTLKGALEDVCGVLGIPNTAFQACGDKALFHPGRAAYVLVDGAEAGYFGEIHPVVAADFELPERACAGILSLESVFEAVRPERKYKRPPKYPPIPRDLALIADKHVTCGEILRMMKDAAGKMLEDAALFDVYTGKQVPEGKKSLAFSLTFRSNERTLVDEEVNDCIQKIIARLEREAGVVLRQ